MDGYKSSSLSVGLFEVNQSFKFYSNERRRRNPCERAALRFHMWPREDHRALWRKPPSSSFRLRAGVIWFSARRGVSLGAAGRCERQQSPCWEVGDMQPVPTSSPRLLPLVQLLQRLIRRRQRQVPVLSSVMPLFLFILHNSCRFCEFGWEWVEKNYKRTFLLEYRCTKFGSERLPFCSIQSLFPVRTDMTCLWFTCWYQECFSADPDFQTFLPSSRRHPLVCK